MTTIDVESYGWFDLSRARIGVYDMNIRECYWKAYDEFSYLPAIFWKPSRKCIMQTPPKNPQVKQYGRKRSR